MNVHLKPDSTAVAAYYYVDTEDENSGSLAVQQKAAREYCRKNQKKLKVEYVDVGAKPARIAFEQMRSDWRKRSIWDTVLIYNRLVYSGYLMQSFVLHMEMDKYGRMIVFTNDPAGNQYMQSPVPVRDSGDTAEKEGFDVENC